MDLDQISTSRLKPGKPESQESAAEDIAAIKDILTALLNVLTDQDQSTAHVHNRYLDGSTELSMDEVVAHNAKGLKQLSSDFTSYVKGVQDAEANREFTAGVQRIQAETIAGWQPYIDEHGIDAAREHWSEVNPGKAFPKYLEP